MQTLHFDGRKWQEVQTVSCAAAGAPDRYAGCESRLAHHPARGAGEGKALAQGDLDRLWTTHPRDAAAPREVRFGYRLGTGEAWAAGVGPRSLVHLDDKRWVTFANVTYADVHGLVATEAGELWGLAIDRPSVYRLAAAKEQIPYGPAEDMPTLLRRRQGQWARVQSPGPRVLGIWAAGPQDVWTVGAEGLVHRLIGDRWYSSYIGRTCPLEGIAGAAGDEVWVQGCAGSVARWDGRRWSRVALPTDARVQLWSRSIWGAAADDVWAAGRAGLVVHFDGKRWSRLSVPTEATLYDVTGFAGQVWFAGLGGTLLHWRPEPARGR